MISINPEDREKIIDLSRAAAKHLLDLSVDMRNSTVAVSNKSVANTVALNSTAMTLACIITQCIQDLRDDEAYETEKSQEVANSLIERLIGVSYGLIAEHLAENKNFIAFLGDLPHIHNCPDCGTTIVGHECSKG